jgi:hypothetical protein
MASAATSPTTRTVPALGRALLAFMIATDAGFVLYWIVTATHALPPSWLFKDYDDPQMQAWNWSFLPLDLAVSASGLLAVAASRAQRTNAQPLAVLSLGLTSASGLMALAFWALRRDFDPAWWAPNAFLLFYPLFFLPRLLATPRSA